MTDIAIFGNHYQERYRSDLRRFFHLLAACPWSVAIERDYWAYLRQVLDTMPANAVPFSGDDFQSRIVLSIGGDGTFLRTARTVERKEIPIMGINSGTLGYLSAARISEAEAILSGIADQTFTVESRSMLEVSADVPLRSCPFALNEVAVLKKDTGSMISVHASIDGQPLADYLADGLIVSTPTGSTGYNLSVGGPIISPSASVWVISPVAAHSLTMRPLVVDDSCEIYLRPSSRSSTFLLTIDGRSVTLPIDTSLHLRKAPFVTRVVHLAHQTFTDSLRSKLLWGIDAR